MAVSILVFVDLALEASMDLWAGAGGSVSILVFVDLALEAKHWGWVAPSDEVSILVFVDLALEESDAQGVVDLIRGFNPCFRGSGSRRI